jgi:hypothetical protein
VPYIVPSGGARGKLPRVMRRAFWIVILLAVQMAGDGAVAGCGGAPAPPDIMSPCDLTKQFGPTYLVGGLDSIPSIAPPTFSPDELTVYVSPDQSVGGGTLESATRPSIDAPFGALAPVPGLGQYILANPTISADGLMLYYITSAMDRDDLVYATRATLDGPWQDPSATGGKYDVPGLGDHVFEPFLELDGLGIFYARLGMPSIPGGLYTSRWNGSGWSSPQLLSTDSTFNPVASSDGLTLFTQDRPGQIARMSRVAVDQPFDAPVEIAELASPVGRKPAWLSPDECRLYLLDNTAYGAPRNVYVTRHGR